MKTIRMVLYICLVACLNISMVCAQNTIIVDSIDIAKSRGDIVSAKSEADALYSSGEYGQALHTYEFILATRGVSSELYYNIGNCYYKMNNIAKALLNYERALLLNPNDDDTHFNLELAKSKTIDKITPLSEFFFVSWSRWFMNLLDTNTWAILSVVSFICLIVCLLFCFFYHQIVIRKVFLLASIVCLILCITSNLSSYAQKKKMIDRNKAIVIQPTVTVKSTPDFSGTDLFVLHEGVKVEIKDGTMSEWKEIRLEDGNVGWIPSKSIEVI